MATRKVLTFKYLGSDYQHKKHFFKSSSKQAGKLVITKNYMVLATQKVVAKKKNRGVLQPG